MDSKWLSFTPSNFLLIYLILYVCSKDMYTCFPCENWESNPLITYRLCIVLFFYPLYLFSSFLWLHIGSLRTKQKAGGWRKNLIIASTLPQTLQQRGPRQRQDKVRWSKWNKGWKAKNTHPLSTSADSLPCYYGGMASRFYDYIKLGSIDRSPDKKPLIIVYRAENQEKDSLLSAPLSGDFSSTPYILLEIN